MFVVVNTQLCAWHIVIGDPYIFIELMTVEQIGDYIIAVL